MTEARAGLARVARSLLAAGLEAVEVYLKEGRSRRIFNQKSNPADKDALTGSGTFLGQFLDA